MFPIKRNFLDFRSKIFLSESSTQSIPLSQLWNGVFRFTQYLLLALSQTWKIIASLW